MIFGKLHFETCNRLTASSLPPVSGTVRSGRARPLGRPRKLEPGMASASNAYTSIYTSVPPPWHSTLARLFLQIESLLRVGPPPPHRISQILGLSLRVSCRVHRGLRHRGLDFWRPRVHEYRQTRNRSLELVMHLNIDSIQSEKLSCVSTPPRSGFRANCISDFSGCALSIGDADLRFGSSLLQQSFRRCAEVMHMCAKVRTRWRFRSDCTHPFFQLRAPC